MKDRFLKAAILNLLLGTFVLSHSTFAASTSASLLRAKKEAEAKGFIFETSHDEIVAKAKKEGFIQILTGFDPNVHPHMINTFKKKYPFLEAVMLEIQGSAASQRFLLELKAGRAG